MKLVASTLSLVTLLATACTGAETPAISKVSVRDKAFVVVKELSPEEIKTFEALWANKVRVSEPFAISDQEAHFKLDITRGAASDRWLYSVSGRTSVLSIQQKAAFQLKDVDAFNKLIGATK